MAWRSAVLSASKTFQKCYSVHNTVRKVSALAAQQLLDKSAAPELSALKNGLRVVTENNGRQSATGTKTRSPKQLETDLAKMGAQLSSYTSREHIALYVQCASNDVEKVVEILVDLIRNSKLDAVSLETERTLIQRQLDEAENFPEEIVFDYLHSAAFQETPMARSTTGTTDSILRLTTKDLQKFAEANFKPVRMVLGAVGDVKHSQLAAMAEKHLSDITNTYSEKSPSPEGIRFTGSEFLYRNDKLPLLYAAIAVEGVPYANIDSIPLKVAGSMIGDWDITQQSSVNAPTVVAQRISHGYNIHRLENFSLSYKDCGLFGFNIVMKGDSISNTTWGLKEVIKGWKHLAVSATDEEVERGKNMYKTRALTALETNASRLDDIAKQVLYTNNAIPMSDYVRAIDSIDKSVIQGAMNRNVYDRDYVGVGVGQTEAMPDYFQMRICGSQSTSIPAVSVETNSDSPATLISKQSYSLPKASKNVFSTMSFKPIAMSRRFSHTDVSFPKFDSNSRLGQSADSTVPAREGEDARRSYSQSMLYGVGGAAYFFLTAKLVQTSVYFKGMPADQLAMANTEIDLTEIPEGHSKTYTWRGKPLFVFHRTPEDIQKAKNTNVSELRDAETDSQRVKKDQWLIVIGVCPHLGCVPLAGKGDYGGYYCPCHGSTFDTSGRIRSGPAPNNLEVPPYEFVEENKLIVGLE